ncbi:MAG: hypothetical protein QXJ59_09850 [Thermofilaceae archaeon]
MPVGRFVKRASGRGAAPSSSRRAAFLHLTLEEEAAPYSRELLMRRLRRLAELAEKRELEEEEWREVGSMLDERIRLYDRFGVGMGGMGTRVAARAEGGSVRLKLPPVARLLGLPDEIPLTELVLFHDRLLPEYIELYGYHESPSGTASDEVAITLSHETTLRDLLRFLVILSAAERAGLKVKDEFLDGLRREDEKLARYLEKAWAVASVFKLLA